PPRALGIGEGVDLLGTEAGHESEGREHLHVLLEEGRGLLDALLHAVRDVEREPDAKVTAQLRLPSHAGPRVTERADDFLVGPSGGGAAADDALDPMLGHEVERTLARADHGLPAFHG